MAWLAIIEINNYRNSDMAGAPLLVHQRTWDMDQTLCSVYTSKVILAQILMNMGSSSRQRWIHASFSNVLLSLASMALTIAAPTANESAVPAVGAWRETFTKTARHSDLLQVQGCLTNCKQLTDYFNGHHGYYSASGWSMSGASELVGWGSCHVRVANMDNANTINIGNGDLTNFMNEVFKLRDTVKVAALGELDCKEARMSISVMG
ncbi:hypothetical protein BJ166DRAFT_500585 [Pestalotiopsis sp. NC0098]|nr:hypothetical protein BJ166DRAFT_500585 [Pestalotiopsis sp. NC0098]